jgi:hypothetical protein
MIIADCADAAIAILEARADIHLPKVRDIS